MPSNWAARWSSKPGDLAVAEPEAFTRYLEPAERYQTMIRAALAKPYLSNVVRAIDALRHDHGAENDPHAAGHGDAVGASQDEGVGGGVR